MTSTTQARPLGDVPAAFIGLLQAQMKLGQQIFEDLTGVKAPSVADSVAAWQTAMRQMPGARSTCDVPPPCWMPRSLGDCTSYVARCSKACVRIVVTNCDRARRTVHVRSEGAAGVKISPASVDLGPMQRATIEACIDIPDTAESGTQYESLIWVDGCNQHYLRWTVIVGSVDLESCYQVAVDDCPDYRHHWYDHFYCMRPCFPNRSTANG